MLGATNRWPQITVHREHVAWYGAALEITVETSEHYLRIYSVVSLITRTSTHTFITSSTTCTAAIVK
jgi:hypothetical protein